jgi:hypothetical protein
MTYLAYRKAIQEAVSAQLLAWGEGREREESARRRAARPLERDLETVLVDLSSEFPAVSALVERRPGGQRKLPALAGEGLVARPGLAAAGLDAAGLGAGSPTGVPEDEVELSGTPAPPAGSAPEGAPAILDRPGPASGPRRPTRYGLRVEFEDRPDSPDLGRLEGSTAWINASHPAYRRAAASRAEAYHVAVAVAMALAPLAVEPAGAQAFVTAFLAAWGEALGRDQRRRQSRRGRLRRRGVAVKPRQ